MIYLVKVSGKWQQTREYLLSDGYAVLEHWIVHSNGQVEAGGPLKDRLWREVEADILENPEWKVCTETRPLARLIIALRKGDTTDEQVT